MRSTLLLAVVVGLALAAPAQSQDLSTSTAVSYARPRILQSVDESQRVVLKGNTHRLATSQYDHGAAPANLPMDRMLLVLKRSPEQEGALRQLLDAQQDKSSPNYHKWLTPDEFGKQFGVADADLQVVTGWLQTHGFLVASVSHGRTIIEFSGTAAQVQEAFGTAIHQYIVKGQSHWANASDPQIPAALAPVVAGVRTLHNFLKKPELVISPAKAQLTYTASGEPQATSTTGLHALSPGDFATIYHINPLYTGGINGAGSSIAVIGRTDIDFGDVNSFEGIFGLPQLNMSVFVNGPDPGIVPGDDVESTLDVSWSRAVAPGAQIDFVISASTNTTDGIDLSTQYAIDNNLADVMTTSYGFCELAQGLTSADLTAVSMLAEQGGAEGITQMVSSGDSGSAGCDNPSNTTAQGPLSVNALAATPFTVAVGGTMFNDTSNLSKYWSTSPGLNTALSYIPENVWNETCTTACQPGQPPLVAGGGGPSSFFTKPSWQSGVTNIPQDGKRDTPDVSLTAALHDGYLLCYAGSCSQNGFWIIGGTSASAPAFAGIMALVNQKMNQLNATTGSRQGQADYVLYKLAAKQNNSQCNASSTTTLPASTCVFNDVTVGNNSVPGELGYNGSNATYKSSVAYDLATGLGSVNVNNLVNNWNSATFSGTQTTLTLNSGNAVNVAHGTSVPLHISVAPSSGTGPVPSGDVSLLTSIPGTNQNVTFFNLDTGGGVTTNTRLLPGGTYNVRAHYGGNGTYAPSDSSDTSVTVTPENSTTTEKVLLNGSTFTSAPYGSFISAEADVVGSSGEGVPTGYVSLSEGLGTFLLNTEGHTFVQNGITNLASGQHSIVATYTGDSSFNSSSSAATNFTITQAPTTSAVQPSASSVAEATSVTLNATLTTNSRWNPPSGTVTFFANGAALGPGVFLTSIFSSVDPNTGAVQYAGGTASFSTSSLPVGQDNITVQYSGDTNYVQSTSAPATVSVLADFSLPGPLTPMTVTRGSKGTTVLTINGNPGYSSTINFTAASCSGLPLESTCSFSPASVTGNGTTTITVSTTAPTAELIQRRSLQFWASSGGFVFAGIVLIAADVGRKRRRISLLVLFIFCALLVGAGCGGGSSSSGPPPNPGTPIGMYTVTVNATSGPLGPHSTTFSLTVQ